MSKIANPTKVITGVNTRWSYANVWDPKSINGDAPKYSVSLIIPKSDTVTVNKIKVAIQASYEEGESKLKGTAKVCPAEFFHSTLPFALLPHTKLAAPDGVLNKISSIKVFLSSRIFLY